MTATDEGERHGAGRARGRLEEEFLTAGSSSFTEFLAAHRPGLLSTRRLLPDGVRAEGIPHGTTVLALIYDRRRAHRGGRGATMGNLIAQRDLEKVHPADDHTAVAFAPIRGARPGPGEAVIRGNPGQAMRGLAVVPLLAGYDPAAPEGGRDRIFGFDVAGGRYEKFGFHAEGPGSPHARGALKKLYRPGMTRREASLAALQALYEAADDDSATGGPDLTRRIYPVVSVITENGFERLAEPETEQLSREMVERRHARWDGPNAAV
ncbi:proteasome subunit beta [Streptomyces sp. NPDC094143]|uniref:proteasome subunit beta n=1 Tax=Streptomyces sp. NPDC094143 TaxID=3155310 RepID=UPI003328338F